MKYRKKPIVVEAYQTMNPMDIETPEGTMHANPDDYIITGVNGERYPCKPDIFKNLLSRHRKHAMLFYCPDGLTEH